MSEKRIDGIVMIAFALGVFLTFVYCSVSLELAMRKAKARHAWPDGEGKP